MKFSTFEQYLSIPRIHRYLQICTSKTRAKKLYDANLKLARDFHPLLGLMEVVLRNRVYDAVAVHFGDLDWIITESQPGGFMLHPSLGRRLFIMKKQVDKSITKLKRRGVIHVTGPRVLSEQTFAFWTDLFEAHHFNMLHQSPINAFSNLPPLTGRHEISVELAKIRKFRNRINTMSLLFFEVTL